MLVPLLSFVLALSSRSPCEESTAFRESSRRASDQSLSPSGRKAAYRQALDVCPKSLQVYQSFTSFLIGIRDFATAKAVVDAGLKFFPDDSILVLQNGAALLSLGEAEKALAELKRIPPTGKSQFYVGLAYRHLGNHAAAQKSLNEAWQLGYRDPYLLYSLIEEDRSVGDKPVGMQHFQLFLRTFPESAWMHLLLGDAYFDSKRDEEARREYLQAVKIDPDMLDAHYRLGYLDFQKGENLQAAQEFQKELDLNPAFADAHLFLGETLLRLGHKSDALIHFRKTLELDANSEMGYHRLAAVQADSNRFAEAAETLRRGESKFPNDATFPAELARVLTRLNRLDEAHQAADRARLLSAQRLKKLDVTGPK